MDRVLDVGQSPKEMVVKLAVDLTVQGYNTGSIASGMCTQHSVLGVAMAKYLISAMSRRF